MGRSKSLLLCFFEKSPSPPPLFTRPTAAIIFKACEVSSLPKVCPHLLKCFNPAHLSPPPSEQTLSVDGFLSSTVSFHPSIPSHHVTTWDPVSSGTSEVSSPDLLCVFAFAATHRSPSFPLSAAVGGRSVSEWQNKPVFSATCGVTNKTLRSSSAQSLWTNGPSVYWTAEAEPVRHSAAVFIGRTSHLQARPVGGVCPPGLKACVDYCRRNKWKMHRWVIVVVVVVSIVIFLFLSLGPSSVCTELWDDVLEQRHVAQREETSTLLYVDWRQAPCLQRASPLNGAFSRRLFGILNVSCLKKLFFFFFVMSCKPHPHLKSWTLFKIMNKFFFSAQKYETVMHKVWVHPWIPVPPPRVCMWSPTPHKPHPILPWTRQAVQSTTELAASVCSLFIFKLISVAIGTSVNLKNLFFFL